MTCRLHIIPALLCCPGLDAVRPVVMSTVIINCASVCDVSTQQQTPTSTEHGTVASDSRPSADSLSLSNLSALSYRVADEACLTRTIAALAEPLYMHMVSIPLLSHGVHIFVWRLQCQPTKAFLNRVQFLSDG